MPRCPSCSLPPRRLAGTIRGAAAWLAAAALAAPVFGQTPADPPQEAPPAVELPQVRDTVTVIGDADDLIRTTGSAFVIQADELIKFTPTNIHSALRVVPGVYLREEDGLGTFPRIGIRASSSGRSDRISIMEDGIPAAMAPYANTSAYYFPNVTRIQSIEVLTGPQVLFWGPQTTSGAINLLTVPIPERATGMVSADFGEYASRNVRAYYGNTIGQFGFLLETVQRGTVGFMNIDRSKLDAGNNIQEYLAKARWRNANRSQQLDVKVLYGDEYADVSYLGLTDADFHADPNRRYGLSELERMDRGRSSVSVRHHAALRQNISLSSTAYRVKTRRDYRRLNQINGVNIAESGSAWIVNNNLPGADLVQGILHGTANTTHANGVRYGNNFQTFTATGAQVELMNVFQTGRVGHLLTAGVRWHQDIPENTATVSNEIYDQVNGSLIFRAGTPAVPNKGKAQALSLWIGHRVGFGSWSLLPIVRIEDIESKANTAVASSNENSLTKATAGIGLNYAANPRWTLLTGVHQGFAPPGSGVAQGTHGEESTNFEAGVRFRQDGHGLDVIGFYSDYSNALRNCLVANPCGGGVVDGTEQAGAKRVHGVEISAFTNLYRGDAVRVPVLVAYTWTGGEYTKASDLPTGVRAGDVLDFTPTNIASFQLGLEGTRWKTYAAFTYTDGSCITTTCNRSGVDSRFLRTEDLFTVDLTSSVRMTSIVEAYAKVENLFDERRITHRGADGARGNPARWVSGGLRVAF